MFMLTTPQFCLIHISFALFPLPFCSTSPSLRHLWIVPYFKIMKRLSIFFFYASIWPPLTNWFAPTLFFYHTFFIKFTFSFYHFRVGPNFEIITEKAVMSEKMNGIWFKHLKIHILCLNHEVHEEKFLRISLEVFFDRMTP